VSESAGIAANADPGGNYPAMAITAMGGVTGALAAYGAGKVNAHIARDNATMADVQAGEAVAAGEYEAGKARLKGRQVEGMARAGEAGQGVVVGAGTSGAILQDTERASAMDALLIKRNAARQALGYQLRAGADRMTADAAESAGKEKAFATLLNAGSEMWMESEPNYWRRAGR
jgi:hypothetical protein